MSEKIVSIENDIVTIDVGLKSEGRIPLNEFSRPGQLEVNIGDETEVYIENVDNANGETSLSREKALKQKHMNYKITFLMVRYNWSALIELKVN